MKVHFKYAFLAGIHARGGVFAVIFLINLVFIILGSLGLLPLAAQITAVSLSGTAIGVMAIVNIISDVGIIRRMFAAPGAYLFALSPMPRKKMLSASVISMFVMDVVTMAVSIFGVTCLSLILAGNYVGNVFDSISRGWVSFEASDILFGLWFIVLMIAGYLLVMLFIIFCAAARKSIFYQKPAGGLLTILMAAAMLYIGSLMTFILAPFGTVTRWGMFFTISLGRPGLIVYGLLLMIQIAALFIAASKLMERKMNI